MINLPMKALFQTLAPVCLAITILASNTAHARTWTSADGKSNFEGDLIGYNAATEQVTVNRGGQEITFDQKLLSDKDITFLNNPLFPALRPSPTAVQEPPAKSKFLAVVQTVRQLKELSLLT